MNTMKFHHLENVVEKLDNNSLKLREANMTGDIP